MLYISKSKLSVRCVSNALPVRGMIGARINSVPTTCQRCDIWRCVSNALPVRGMIGARINSVPTTCQRCDLVPESVEHMLFSCNFSRAAWLASSLSLRSDQLHGTFKEIVTSLIEMLSEMDFVRFMCMAWAMWRVRNEAVIGGKQQNFTTCFKYYKEVLAIRQSVYYSTLVQHTSHTCTSIESQQQLVPIDSPICYVDGSWSPDGLAGIGVYITIQGRVVQWASKRVQAMSSSQAEAIAVLQGYKMLQSVASGRSYLYSDSLEIVDSLAHKQPLIHDWRSFNEVWEAWLLQNSRGSHLSAAYCERNDTRLQLAHILANLGKTLGWERLEHDLDFSSEELNSCVRIDLL